MRYPRGKSWNWYKRHKGTVPAEMWLEIRKAESSLKRSIFRDFYGPGNGRQFEGLAAFVDNTTDVIEIDPDNIQRTSYSKLLKQ